MKYFYLRIIAIICLVSSFNKVSAQTIGCSTPTMVIKDVVTKAVLGGSIPCNYANNIYISQSPLYQVDIFGNPIASDAPCMRLEVFPTNANSSTNNSLTVQQGTATIGSVCTGTCAFAMPNTTNWTLFFAGLDPTQSHGFTLCHSAVATNMTYSVFSCYSSAVISSGTWTNTTGAGCQTVTIAAGTAIGTASYALNPSVASTATLDTKSGLLIIDPSQLPAGTYTATYSFDSQAGCTSTNTKTFTITNPYSAAWTSVGPLCTSGSCVGLTVTGTAGGVFTGAAISSGSFCPSLVGAGSFPTTYTVGITPQCGASVTQTVVVNANPTANAGPTQSITCAQSQTVLVGSGGGSYSWSGPGIVAGGATASPTVNTAGVYSLITTSLGCSSPASTVQVGLNTTAPTPNPIASNTITCLTPNVNAAITATAGMTYNWVASPGNIVSGATTSSPSVNQAGTYNFTVTNSSTGCMNNGFVTVTSNTFVSNTPSTTGSVTCSSNTISLNTATVGAGPFTYTWTAPAGSSILAGTFSQGATGSGAGIYSVTVKDGSNGCSRTATITANINMVAPTGTASVSSGVITCTNNAINLTVNPAGFTYAWSAGGGGSITSGAASQNATGAGNGTYSVLVTNAVNGCTVMSTVSPSVNTTVITPSIAAAAILNCTQVAVPLNGSPGAGVTYTWAAPSGTNIVSGGNSASANVNGPGTYTLSVTNAINGCIGTQTVAVTQSLATPTISAVTQTANLICGAASVVLTGSSLPVGTPTWSSSGGGFASGINNYTVAATTATIYVLSVAHPTTGCISSLSYTVIPDVNSPTVTLSSSSATITCLTTQVTTTATSNPTGVTYAWSGPVSGIVGASNTSAVTGSIAGTYSAIVTNTANSCQSTVAFVVTANNAPVTPTVASSNTITCNTLTTSIIAGAGVGTYTYSWSGPSSFTSTSQTFTTNVGGTYTVMVTNTSSGCSGTQTVSAVTDTAIPTAVSVSPTTFTLLCTPPTTTLTATATGASTYSWIAPAGGSIISGTNSASAGISGPGIYSVIATAANGCSAPSATASVSQSTLAPTFTVSNSSPSITCMSASQTISVAITSTVPISSYSWSPASGISGSTTGSVVTFTTSGVFSGIITATNGCTSTAIISVGTATTAPNIVAGTGTAQAISCTSSVVTIAPTFTPAGAYTYSWSGPGVVGTASNSSVQVNLNGTYSLTVTDPLTGCSTTSISVPVFGTSIPPTLTVTSSSSIGIGCTPLTSTISLTADATPSTGITYNWSNAATTSVISLSTPGVYSVVVTDASSSCSVAATYTVANSTNTPNINAGSNVALPCGTTATLTLNGSSTTAGVAYSWTGSGILSGANTASPSVNTAGIYTLTVTDATTGCVSSATVAVANSAVIAGFTADVTNGVSPLTVNFSNTSTGAINYNWTFGTGSTSTATNTSETFTGNGTFVVTLIASSGLCSDTVSIEITVNDGLSLEIPNVFTPNDDGVNDVFTITSKGVKTISLSIFNRWGQKMYEFTGAKAAWDGRIGDGNKATDGTYFYFVKATGFDDKEISKNGSLSLFR